MGIRNRKRGNSLGMLILNVVLICAMVVNGTYAWIHIGQSVNGALTYMDNQHEVTLVKYQKDTEGEPVVDDNGNPTPLEDEVEFTIFKINTDGSTSQVGSPYLTNEYGEISAYVSSGNYYFQETKIPSGFGPDLDDDNNEILYYYFTVTADGEVISGEYSEEVVDVEEAITEETTTTEEATTEETTTTDDEISNYDIIVYNRPSDIKLEIEKEVINKKESATINMDQLFAFDISFGDDSTYSYYIVDVESDVALVKEQGTDNTALDISDNVSVDEEIDNSKSQSHDIEIYNTNSVLSLDTDIDAVEENVQQPVETEEELEELYEDIIIEPSINEINSNDAVSFIANLSDFIIYDYSNISDQEVPDSGEITNKGTFYLTHGQKAIFYDVSPETYYIITERKQPYYLATVEGDTVGDVGYYGGYIKFINEYDEDIEYADLYLSKVVEGEGADPDEMFDFYLEVNGVQSGPYSTSQNEGYVVIENIPVWATYVIWEDDDLDDDYYPKVSLFSDTIVNTEDIYVEFVNIYDPDREMEEFGDLVIRKEIADVEGYTIDTDIEFTFRYSYEDSDELGTYISDSFTLKHDQFYVLEDVPSGTIVTITETYSQGYAPEYSVVELPVYGMSYDDELGLAEQDAQVYTFINTPLSDDDIVTLTIYKEVVDGPADVEPFEFTLTVNGIEHDTIYLADGGMKEITLIKGSRYDVAEDYYGDYFQEYLGTTFTQKIDKDENVFVTNTYKDAKVIIKGTKEWGTLPNQDLVDKIDETVITIWLLRKSTDDTWVELENTTTSYNQDNPWEYSFQVEKYNNNGEVYEYWIKEEEVENFKPTYSYDEDTDSYNVLNTYTPESTYYIPDIDKQIKGTNYSDTTFEFELIGQNDEPMPLGTSQGKFTTTVLNDGSTRFPSITYTEEGTYVYYISEVSGDDEDWVYDETKYSLVVQVYTDESIGYGLLPKGTLYVGTTPVIGNVVFENEYVGEGSENPDDDDLDDEDDSTTKYKYVSGTKTWDHGLNSVEHQPSKLVVYILGDGEVYQATETSASNNWSYRFSVPKLNDDGEEIKYTIGEEPVDGYNGMAIGLDLYNTFDLSSLVEPDSPQTSDYSQIWIWVWGLVASTITFVYVNRRKRVLRHGRRW